MYYLFNAANKYNSTQNEFTVIREGINILIICNLDIAMGHDRERKSYMHNIND